MPSGVYKRTSPAWNKGKKWSEDHKKKLSIAHLGKKSPHIGVPRTPETRKKISNSMKGLIKSKETRLKHSKNMIYKMKNGIIPQNDTLPERLFENQLLFNNILYVKQYKYALGIADFWLPETNTIVEIDGIYWHSKPEVIERDKRHNEWLKNNDYNVLRFTETEIHNDVNGCLQQIKLIS